MHACECRHSDPSRELVLVGKGKDQVWWSYMTQLHRRISAEQTRSGKKSFFLFFSWGSCSGQDGTWVVCISDVITNASWGSVRSGGRRSVGFEISRVFQATFSCVHIVAVTNAFSHKQSAHHLSIHRRQLMPTLSIASDCHENARNSTLLTYNHLAAAEPSLTDISLIVSPNSSCKILGRIDFVMKCYWDTRKQ